MSYNPISDYGIIGNMVSCALISKDGSLDWCCLPRFDSPAVFAAILDDEKGGKFTIQPENNFKSHQVYLENTNILQTTFRTDTGTATMTDFMPCYRRDTGRLVRFNEIHRILECTNGEIELQILFKPKPNFGLTSPSLETTKHGVLVKGDNIELSCSSSMPFEIVRDHAVATVKLHQAEKITLVLKHGTDGHPVGSLNNSLNKLDQTKKYWQQQTESTVFSGKYRDYLVRSYLVIHLLVYSPTGAIIAAPTTSLPEEIGGERNWDYRFSWLRDASLTANALLLLDHKEEAISFMGWLLKVGEKYGTNAQTLYAIDFEDPIDEQILEHLEGYRGSRPVRIGNAAYNQRQLDIFGEILDTVYNYEKIGGYIGKKEWKMLETFVEAACDLWSEPGSGIWEVRGGPFHFVLSKVMCWVAIDRGIKLAESTGNGKNITRWRNTASKIRDDILEKGWNSKKGAFTQHYDTDALDASNLLIPLFGFLPISDERIISTIDHTISELGWNGLLRRYRSEETDDGIKGSEGAFLWCSFWLVRCLLRLGRLEEASKLYQKLLGYTNHLKLMSEMVDPVSGESLGNFPQALSHLAIIITGIELTKATGNHEMGQGGTL